jgi:hypothetical protein
MNAIQSSRTRIRSLQQKDVNLFLIAAGGSVAFGGGEKLIYQQAGSHPGGMLRIDLGSGELQDIAPGTKITTPFPSVNVRLSPSSIRAGNARLVIFSDPADDIVEPAFVRPPPPVFLSSTAVGDGSFTIPENVQPTTVDDIWDVTGWRRLRVFVDGGAANTLTTVTLIPWFYLPWLKGTTAKLFEQGLGTIALPDSGATGYRYRVFELDLVGMVATAAYDPNNLTPSAVFMSLEIRDLLPAAATQLILYVYGVE